MTMCVTGTPVEHYPELGLWVKREDLCCPRGPNFSKTRGVYSHIAARPEKFIGVLDTSHSQGGWAVAKACSLLGKRCNLWYPVRKNQDSVDLAPQQLEARNLGAHLYVLGAGRSAILYHRAKKELRCWHDSSYMMPNALKLPESVSETAAEVLRTELPLVRAVLVSASSGTIAAGVIAGLMVAGWSGKVVVHQGYTRSITAIQNYIQKCVQHYFDHSTQRMGGGSIRIFYVDEGYSYADEARPGGDPPFPCNAFYDLKAFRWWERAGRHEHAEALLWNIG